jgi:peptidoglycan/xylan/chitin deacetylase (PgdA/CDA1 family)
VPAVSASFPVNRDTGVPPDAPVTLVFNRPMDRTSVEAAVVVAPPISVTLAWAGDQRLTIAPTAWLTATTYTVTLTNTARTADGEPLARPFVVRFQAGHAEGKVPIPILMYHALIDLEPDASASLREWSNSPATFTAHMDYLDREGYNPIGFRALMDYLERDEPVPPKSVLITFDDGHRTFPTEALPVLLKHKFKATLFIVTDYPEGQYGAYMHWDAIRAAMDAGIDIESHTMSHGTLTRMALEEAEREVRDSKALIKEHLSRDYPYGAFSDAVIALLAKHGYRAAVTINPAPWQVRGDSYRLNRVHIPYDATMEDFVQWLP